MKSYRLRWNGDALYVEEAEVVRRTQNGWLRLRDGEREWSEREYLRSQSPAEAVADSITMLGYRHLFSPDCEHITVDELRQLVELSEAFNA